MKEEPEDEDGVPPLVLSVGEYFAQEGLDSRDYPVTVEVRNQLANLLLESAGTPQHASQEALFRAVMTAVSNLEIINSVRFKKLVELKAELSELRLNAVQVHTSLLQLQVELLELGVISPTPTLRIRWFPDDDDYDDDDDDDDY